MNSDYSELESIVQQWELRELCSDVHKETAAKLFDKSVVEVTDTERKQAKTRNFLLMYSR